MSDEIRLIPRMQEKLSPAPVAEPSTLDAHDLIVPPTACKTSYCPSRQASVDPDPSQIRTLDYALWQSRGWMKFLAVLMILNGVVSLFSLWGILFCWLPIWVGVTLFSAANHIQAASQEDSEGHLRVGLEKLALFFKINGVVALLGIAIGVCLLAAVMMGALGGAGFINQNLFPPP